MPGPLKQPSSVSTLLGCLQGVSDAAGLGWTPAELAVYSTHAFLINLHNDLSPSSPYVWNHQPFWAAMADLGLVLHRELGLDRATPQAHVELVTRTVEDHLQAGGAVMVDFLEHQLVVGRDRRVLKLAQPWGGFSGVELSTLHLDTWAEALDREGWVHLSLVETRPPRVEPLTLLRSALDRSLRREADPHEWEHPGYRIGDGAWQVWLNAVDRGLGTSHGHWWATRVWSEGRRLAADYVATHGPQWSPRAAALGPRFVEVCSACADRIAQAGNREASAVEQRRLLTEARALDRERVELSRSLWTALAD